MTMQTTTNGTNGAALQQRAAVVERVIALGDLRDLSPRERVQYYLHVCDSVGLNPATRPFEYISLNGKLTLYSTKNCTDQLRQIHTISVASLTRETIDGIHVVTATVTNALGRRDEDVGAVSVANLKGEAMANALMKATTKAKRRATLSICGLSFLDESEIEAVKGAQRVTVTADGEIIDAKPEPPSAPDLTKQLAASIDWTKWAAKFVADIEKAATKGDVNIITTIAKEEAARLHAEGVTMPDDVREIIKTAALARKAAL
jgi:hypothetical protein